jgi:ElaA protein
MVKSNANFLKAAGEIMITWVVKKFQELSSQEIYDMWALRESVFVVEQKIIYLDADGKDLRASHVLGYHKNRLAAYSRIIHPIKKDEPIFFGRVCTHQDYRKVGLGKQLVAKTMEFIKNHTDASIVKIYARSHLAGFYEQFGFKATSDSYLIEEGIMHTDMQALIQRNVS